MSDSKRHVKPYTQSVTDEPFLNRVSQPPQHVHKDRRDLHHRDLRPAAMLEASPVVHLPGIGRSSR